MLMQKKMKTSCKKSPKNETAMFLKHTYHCDFETDHYYLYREHNNIHGKKKNTTKCAPYVTHAPLH